MTVKELVADLIGCNADSIVVLEDDVEFTDEYGKVSGTCYQIDKVVKHGRSVSLHFDNRQHFMREQESKIGHWGRKTKVDAYDIAGVKTWGIKCQCDRCDFTTIVVEDFGYYKYCPNCGAKMESEDKE